MKYPLSLVSLCVVKNPGVIKVMSANNVVYSFSDGADVDRGIVNDLAKIHIDLYQVHVREVTTEDLYQLLMDTIEARIKESASDAKPDSPLLCSPLWFGHDGAPTISVVAKVQPIYSGLMFSVYVRQDWRLAMPNDIIFGGLIQTLFFDIQDGDIIFVEGYPIGMIKYQRAIDNVPAYYYLDRNEPKRSTLNAWENQTGLDYTDY